MICLAGIRLAVHSYTKTMTSFTARTLILLGLPAAMLAANFNGTWDATILSGTEHVPFRMEVTESPAKVCFFEDTQPVCSTSARIEEGKLVARWDFLNTELHLESKDGGLTGGYHNVTSTRESAVEAHPHQPAPKAATAPAKIAGEWEAHATTPRVVSWQFLVEQTGSDIKGTILRVDGDDGTLVGRIDGKHFSMSHFSGDRPVLIDGDVMDDGTLELRMGRSKLMALRPADARARNLPKPDDPETWARAKNPSEPFHFRLPDLNGRMYTEDNFRGKPFIVTITGSWCPNCRDEAPFMQELYQRYHAKGLEIAAFCFERAGDTDHAQLKAFLRKYGITYTALLGPEPSAEGLQATVPQIEHLSAYPSAIYVGRNGLVRSVHTGFPSAGSGPELTRTKAEIRKLVESMIAEK
jgi:thiol-disulfide isomerase/thioredoxin